MGIELSEGDWSCVMVLDSLVVEKFGVYATDVHLIIRDVTCMSFVLFCVIANGSVC